MTSNINIRQLLLLLSLIWLGSCKTPAITAKTEDRSIPGTYVGNKDSTNAATLNWREYFKDPALIALIDTALHHNQELNIMMQEIEMSKNEVMARKGEYLPFLNFRGGAGPDRAGKYTWDGFSEDDLRALKSAYKRLFLKKDLNMSIALSSLKATSAASNAHVADLIQFVESSSRGVTR